MLEIVAQKSGDFSGTSVVTTSNLVSTERRKRRDSAGESNKAESKQPRQNCHIFGTGKTYLVQEQLAEAGEERGKCPRK